MEKEEFTQKIKAVAKRVDQFRDSLKTEEATKSSLIQPFFFRHLATMCLIHSSLFQSTRRMWVLRKVKKLIMPS